MKFTHLVLVLICAPVILTLAVVALTAAYRRRWTEALCAVGGIAVAVVVLIRGFPPIEYLGPLRAGAPG